MAQQTITQGSPPIVWSTIDDAFQKINSNFTELYLSIGGTGVDLSSISADLIPDVDLFRDLGRFNKRWKDLYLGGQSLYLGDALITADQSGAVNLPVGSKVGGILIKDPSDVGFGQISVEGQDNVFADTSTGILNFSGDGISITTNAATDTVTFSNSGVTSAIAGSGINLSSSVGAITITNSGVTSALAGSGISVSAASGNVTITNSGVISLLTDPGSGISLSTVSPGIINVSNSAPNIIQPVHRFIAITGQTTLDAAGPNSTLRFAGDENIFLTTDPVTNTINITLSNILDIRGSVFADDSTLLVDGTEGKIVGTISSFDGVNSITMDPVQGLLLASTGLIDIQGAAGAQIGIGAGTSGDIFIGSGSNSIIIDGILKTSTITSDDSSQISIIPQTQFNSNILVDGDIVLNGSNRIQANTGIDLIPNLSAESFGSTLNIQGFPGGEGSPGVAISTESAFISVGSWIMFSDGGLYSTPLINAPDFPLSSTIYMADGANWDPLNYQQGVPYPVFYDGNDFVPMSVGGGSPGGGGGGGGDFDFSVAADDSTLRKINSGESIKFIGTNGITTASDSEGNITISAAGVSGLASRTTPSGSTGNIADAATANVTITGFKGYLLYKIQTSAAAWVRIYTSVAARTADSGRSEGVDPSPGAGVIAEAITTGAETVLITPGTIGFNDESSPTTNIELAVTNKSGGSADITVTLTVVKVED